MSCRSLFIRPDLEQENRRLPIPATAAGPVWGTADGVVLDDQGARIGGVPGAIDEVRLLGSQIILGTDNGVWSIGDDTQNWSDSGICDNFITGITRHQGDLVVSTFNGGACQYDGQAWRPLELPSTMANDVLSTGDDLWVATAEGLVQVGEAVFTEVGPDLPHNTPATNHNGVNALALGVDGLWVADVLGPVQVDPLRRYRWHVSGRSYQAIAACPTGEVWVGSEDDGLAVRGITGSRNGRSDWHHGSFGWFACVGHGRRLCRARRLCGHLPQRSGIGGRKWLDPHPGRRLGAVLIGGW